MSNSFEVIKLKPKGPLHIGRGWGDLDHSEPLLHSDTLKSALFSALIQISPEWRKKAEEFFKSFIISSSFPYCNDELFLPKLQLKRKFHFEDIPEEKQAKTAKSVEYLSLNLFKKYIVTDEIISVRKKQLSEDSKFIFEKDQENIRYIFKNQVQQRVNVKFFLDSAPFYADRIFFNKDCGIYFLAFFNTYEIKETVLRAIEYLGSQGIGTDRTVGNGFFDLNFITKHEEFDVENQDAFASLGLYLPSVDELDKIDINNSSWGLIKRGGYMAGSEYIKFRHLLKKNIYMFTEGSVFKTQEQPKGKFVNVKPEWNDTDMHDVWRCGMPAFIPVKL